MLKSWHPRRQCRRVRQPPIDLKFTAEAGDPPILMQPMVVSASKSMRGVLAAIDREEQDRREGRFSSINGGLLSRLGPVQMGSWWSPGEGWTLLRRHRVPTFRQVEAADAKMKELEALAKMSENSKK